MHDQTPTYDTISDCYRTHKPEWVTGKDGRKMRIQICEELIEGRWEPYVTIRRADA
jgi:hypothetical protein